MRTPVLYIRIPSTLDRRIEAVAKEAAVTKTRVVIYLLGRGLGDKSDPLGDAVDKMVKRRMPR